MKKHSAFMWGYWGWGNHTRELVRTVDAIERERGRRPPIFADVRYHRGVMAKGFHGDTFRDVAGNCRYRWLRKLGNANIGGEGPIRIADRSGIIELLQLIIKAEEENRRVIFFCACAEPRYCHRLHVARLAVRAAHWHGIDLTVIEWPGGKPQATILPIDHRLVRKALNDATRITLEDLKPRVLRDLKALPWCSPVELRSDRGRAVIIGGPAQLAAAGWYLPSIGYKSVKDMDTLNGLKKQAAHQWKTDGYAPLSCATLDSY